MKSHSSSQLARPALQITPARTHPLYRCNLPRQPLPGAGQAVHWPHSCPQYVVAACSGFVIHPKEKHHRRRPTFGDRAERPPPPPLTWGNRCLLNGYAAANGGFSLRSRAWKRLVRVHFASYHTWQGGRPPAPLSLRPDGARRGKQNKKTLPA